MGLFDFGSPVMQPGSAPTLAQQQPWYKNPQVWGGIGRGLAAGHSGGMAMAGGMDVARQQGVHNRTKQWFMQNGALEDEADLATKNPMIAREMFRRIQEKNKPAEAKAPKTLQTERGHVQWNPESQSWNPISVSGIDGKNVLMGGEGGKPMKLTEGQSKQIMFARRMDDSTRLIDNLEGEGGYDPTNLKDGLAREAGIVGNYFVSAEGQQYITAARDWISGVLRLDSGAAVPEEEFWRYFGTYFPQPGDVDSVVKQKAEMRRSIRQGMGEASGGRIDEARRRAGAGQEAQPTAPVALPDFKSMSDEQLMAIINGQ